MINLTIWDVDSKAYRFMFWCGIDLPYQSSSLGHLTRWSHILLMQAPFNPTYFTAIISYLRHRIYIDNIKGPLPITSTSLLPSSPRCPSRRTVTPFGDKVGHIYNLQRMPLKRLASREASSQSLGLSRGFLIGGATSKLGYLPAHPTLRYTPST